jgi:hypothetical protein
MAGREERGGSDLARYIFDDGTNGENKAEASGVTVAFPDSHVAL